MSKDRPYSALVQRLKTAGLRPTRQRLALAKLLFEDPGGSDRHITAEQLHAEAVADNVRVSLATIYNSLHQFTTAGLLREVVVESGRSYFDRSEEHTSELQSLMRISYAVFCLKKKTNNMKQQTKKPR